MNPIVIIGTGLAGYTLARELRKLDKDLPLHLLTADDGRFYSKPMLSNAFHSHKTPDALAMNTAEQMASQLNARIDTQVSVSAIDTTTHGVTYNQETLVYSKLVLALGADPIRLPMEGDAADAVLSVNDLAGYTRFRAAAASAQRILIMGAGLIGCEFANDLVGAGYAVEVADPAPQPLGRLLPPRAAAALGDALAGLGVRWHFGVGVKSVSRRNGAYSAVLTDGSAIETDVVLSAIGLRPRIALAAGAGIKTQRGILTNKHLETDAADVYALGDCAEVAGLVLPFVMPIMHAARALAKTLSGSSTAVQYPAMPVVVKTPALPVVISPPPMNASGAWQESGAGADVRSLFLGPGESLLGFALTGSANAEKNALVKQLPPVLA
jgi:rubredoxin---NAD+ reductase